MNSFDNSSSYFSTNFESLFDGFLSYLSISKSSFTVNQYKYTVKVFFDFTKCVDVNKETFYSFIKLQKEKGNSAAYIKNIFAAVKTFYKYLNDFNIYKINSSIFNIELPKAEQRKQKVTLYKESIEIISKIKTNRFSDFRDKIIIEILSATGIRRNEFMNLKVQDFNFENKTLTIWKTKNKTPRTIPVSETLIENIKEYLEKRKKIAKTDFFLITEQGTGISRGVFYLLCRKIKKLTGIKTTPHAFRRGLATDLYNNNVEIEHIADMLGHKNMDITRNVYIYGNTEKLKEAVSVHPSFSDEKINSLKIENDNLLQNIQTENLNILELYKILVAKQNETQEILNKITLLQQKIN